MPSASDEPAVPTGPTAKTIRQRIFALLLALCLHSFAFSVAYMLPIGGAWGGRFGTLLHSVTLGTIMVIGSLALAWKDPDKLHTFALRIPRNRRNVAVEIAVGIGSVFVMYAAVLLFTFAMMALLPSSALENAAKSKEEAVSQFAQIPIVVSLAIAACAGIWEELAFRGFLFSRIKALFNVPEPDEDTPRKRGPLLLSILLCSFFFALGHGYQGPIGLIQTFVAGFALAVLTAWRGSLYAAIAAHVCVDAIGLVAVHFVKAP